MPALTTDSARQPAIFFPAKVTDPARGEALDDVAFMAPSLAGDDGFRSWWQHGAQRGASPGMIMVRVMRLVFRA